MMILNINPSKHKPTAAFLLHTSSTTGKAITQATARADASRVWRQTGCCRRGGIREDSPYSDNAAITAADINPQQISYRSKKVEALTHQICKLTHYP
jgi:hypothetical protein